MSVSVSEEILLSDGYWCQPSFGPTISGYSERLYTASYYDTHDEQTIQQELEAEATKDASEKDLTYVNLPSQTEYISCIAPYTLSNGEKRWGHFFKRRITTPASTASAGVSIGPITTDYNSTYGTIWSFNIRTTPSHYYILAYLNQNAVSNYSMDIPSIMYAQLMYQNPSETQTNMKGDIGYPRSPSDYALLVVAWGGPSYGNIAKNYKNTRVSTSPQTPASSTRTDQHYRCSASESNLWKEALKQHCVVQKRMITGY